MILCGACCSAIFLATANYTLLNIFAVLYGVFLASSFSFTPIVLVELLPLETFTKAYGLQLMCQGIGHLGGPPFAGERCQQRYGKIINHVRSFTCRSDRYLELFVSSGRSLDCDLGTFDADNSLHEKSEADRNWTGGEGTSQ
jgi:ABC-type uncharacterized transport system permease subunit